MKRFFFIAIILLIAIPAMGQNTLVKQQYNLVLFDKDVEIDHSALANYDSSSVIFAKSSGDWYIFVFDSSGDTTLYFQTSGKLRTKNVYSIQKHFQNPDDLSTGATRATKSQVIWYNSTGFAFQIDSIRAISDSDNYDFNLFESASNIDIGTANDVLIDLIECDANGTGGYYDVETTISHSIIEEDHYIIFEHSAGATTSVQVCIMGHLK